MTHALYLPQIANEPDILAQGYYAGMTLRAYRFAVAWLGLLGERAKIMQVDERLVKCATDHAEFLHSRTPEEIEARKDAKAAMHMSRDGTMSNARVVNAGYRLPEWWPLDKNSVEACARDWHDPAIVAVSLAHHDAHHDIMFGIGFWEPSVVWGAGCAGDDYCIVICPPESTP